MLESNLTTGVGGAVSSNAPTSGHSNKPEAASGSSAFGKVLDNKLGTVDAKTLGKTAAKNEGLRFSSHALERMQSRGISFKPDELSRLNDAIDKAATKGSKNALMLMGDNALIVSVKNRTVVTAMDREAMKENVFTNIDSTVIL